jgi:integrase
MTVNYEIGKPRADKRRRITLLLCIGKTKKRIKTELLADVTDLNRKGKIRNDSPLYNKVQKRIKQIESEYATLDTFLSARQYSATEAYEQMRKTDIPMFFDYADQWLERAEMKGKKNYKTALRNFKAFVGDIPFSMFSHSLLNDYLYSLRDKPRAQSLYLNAIKRIYTEAEKDYEIRSFNAFRLDIPRQQPTRKRALDREMLRKIFSWNGISRRAILARDCAILSFCLCGTNSADLFSAPPIKNGIFSYDRQKTKDRRSDNAHIEIEIPEQIKALVKRYKGSTKAFSFSTMYCSDATFNQNLNKGLKIIGDELGIKDLTFYAFRHSWATIARNDLGIEKSVVNDALNHTDPTMRITDIYIKKDFRLINEANRKVVEYVTTSATP